MATRYRLPAELGGGVAELIEWEAKGHAGFACLEIDGVVLIVAKEYLTEVKPPLPEEPPVGAVVMVDGEACQHFDVPYEDELVWASVGSPKRMTWVQLCDLALPGTPTPLVPDPFAEPLELPWRGQWDGGDSAIAPDCGGVVSDSIRQGSVIAAVRLAPDAARQKAKALWAAADQAERAS